MGKCVHLEMQCTRSCVSSEGHRKHVFVFGCPLATKSLICVYFLVKLDWIPVTFVIGPGPGLHIYSAGGFGFASLYNIVYVASFRDFITSFGDLPTSSSSFSSEHVNISLVAEISSGDLLKIAAYSGLIVWFTALLKRATSFILTWSDGGIISISL